MYQHETSRDTAFVINKLLYFGKADVTFYILNIIRHGSHEFSPCAYGTIRLRPRKEYNVINLHKRR
jgi:hypothetical protein